MLRSKRVLETKTPEKYPSAEKKDFIDQIIILANEFENISSEYHALYDRKNKIERLSFNKKFADMMAKQKNAEIGTFIRNQKSGDT